MVSEERKKAFVVFASTYEAAVNHLTLEQMGELFVKMGRYSLEGEDVKSDTPMVDVILKMTAPNMDAAEKRHQAAIENGKKGKDKGGGVGRPYKGETQEEYQARVSVWKESLEGGGNNPQKPLNKNTNINTDRNTDNDIERKIDKDKDIEINKKTNVEVIPDSILTNCSSSFDFESSNLEEDETDQGEEPRREIPRQEVISPYSKGQNEGGGNQDEEDDDNDNNQSSPPIRTDRSPKNHQSLIDEMPNTPPAPPKKSKREELTEYMEMSLELAAEEKEKSEELADFMPYLYQAKEAYKELHNCDEQRAREEVSWKLHCLMENRKKKAELAAMLSKSHKDETPDLVSPK